MWQSSDIGLDILYCGKRRNIIFMPWPDLDRTMPNVELIRDIFICYNIFKFQVPSLIIY